MRKQGVSRTRAESEGEDEEEEDDVWKAMETVSGESSLQKFNDDSYMSLLSIP